MEGPEVSKFSQYMETIANYGPLFCAGFVVALLTKAKDAYLEHTTKQKIIKALFDAAVTGTLAAGMAMILPMIVKDVSPAIEFGVAVLTGRFGNSLIECFLKAKFNFVMIDPQHPEDLEPIRDEMSDEERMEHAKRCPFSHEHRCINNKQSCDNCEVVNGGIADSTDTDSKP